MCLIRREHIETTLIYCLQDVTNATEVDLGAGLVYKDIRIGGGQSVQQGFLTVLHYRQPTRKACIYSL